MLGNGKKQETADGHPRDDDDRNLLPPWRTTAVKAGGLDQAHAWSGMQLVSPPPSCATMRAKQNSKLPRHRRPQKSNLPMDHQSGGGIGSRSPLRETFRIPLRRIHEIISKSITCSGVKKNIVRYQCRHSGASLDKAGLHRTMLEIKKRGRWKMDSSIARYEKSGILAQNQSDRNKSQLN